MATICVNTKKGIVVITVQGTITDSTMKLIDTYVNKHSLTNVMISQKQNPVFPTSWQQLVNDFYKSRPKKFRIRMY